MDYYQGVVVDYLQVDRAMFVNQECLIQLHPGRAPAKNEHWYCDALAINLRDKKVFLCEVTYAKGMSDLVKRLKGWNDNWEGVRAALVRDSWVDGDWEVRPWLFVPKDFAESLKTKLISALGPEESWSLRPKVTTLESIPPWEKNNLNHSDRTPAQSDPATPEEARC